MTKKQSPLLSCSIDEGEKSPDGFRVGFAGGGRGLTAPGPEPGGFRRRTGGTDRRADMDFSCACQLDDSSAVFVVDSSSRQDADAARRCLLQSAQQLGSIFGPGRVAGGQDPVYPKLAEDLQCGKGIGGRVEGAVEGGTRSRGGFDETGGLLGIDAAVFSQGSQHDAVGSRPPG